MEAQHVKNTHFPSPSEDQWPQRRHPTSHVWKPGIIGAMICPSTLAFNRHDHWLIDWGVANVQTTHVRLKKNQTSLRRHQWIWRIVTLEMTLSSAHVKDGKLHLNLFCLCSPKSKSLVMNSWICHNTFWIYNCIRSHKSPTTLCPFLQMHLCAPNLQFI